MYRILILIIISFLVLSGCSDQPDKYDSSKCQELTLYATNGLLSDVIWENVLLDFEKLFNCKINLQVFEDAVPMLEQVIAEKDSSVADVVWGIDNTIFTRALEESLFAEYEPKNLKYVDEKYIFDPSHYLTPVSYCDLAFIYDSEFIENAPVTFGEMQDGKWKEQIIVMNPRTSSLGNAMLHWSLAAFGESGYTHFWRSVKANIFKVSDSSEEAYNMFLAGQAPLMLGFSSIPAYHTAIEKTTRYKAVIPKEGGFRLIEAVGVVRTSSQTRLAEQLVEYLLSESCQRHIAVMKWLFPVNKNIQLSAGMELVPMLEDDCSNSLTREQIEQGYNWWIRRWERIMKK